VAAVWALIVLHVPTSKGLGGTIKGTGFIVLGKRPMGVGARAAGEGRGQSNSTNLSNTVIHRSRVQHMSLVHLRFLDEPLAIFHNLKRRKNTWYHAFPLMYKSTDFGS
jgi:hypothetical protein